MKKLAFLLVVAFITGPAMAAGCDMPVKINADAYAAVYTDSMRDFQEAREKGLAGDVQKLLKSKRVWPVAEGDAGCVTVAADWQSNVRVKLADGKDALMREQDVYNIDWGWSH